MMPFSGYSTFSDSNFSCFGLTFCIQKLSGSPQWHVTFDLKQVALKFQKPLAGEKLSFISNVFPIFKYYQIIGCHGNLVKCEIWSRCRDKFLPAVKFCPPPVTLPSVLSAVCIAQN